MAAARAYKSVPILPLAMSESESESDIESDTEFDDERVGDALTWPDLVMGLYDRLTGRGAEIAYEFEDLEVDVPNRAGPEPEHAHWRVDGKLRITTRKRNE